MSWSKKHIHKNLEIVKKILTRLMLNSLETKNRWCCSKKIDQTRDKLRQLMLVEEFKRCIQSDVETFLDENKLKL